MTKNLIQPLHTDDLEGSIDDLTDKINETENNRILHDDDVEELRNSVDDLESEISDLKDKSDE